MPVLVPTTRDSGFKMSPEQLRKAITPRSKLLMLNSPCNPTGAVYTRAELEKLADVVMDSPLAVLSDEIYEQLTYGDAKPTCFATLRPKLAEQTLTISGASKSYAMTGWRMGWTVAPKPIIKAMGEYPEPGNELPLQRQPVRLVGGIDRAAGLRGTDADGIRQAARTGSADAGTNAGHRYYQAGWRVLCILRRIGPLWETARWRAGD